MLQMERLSLGSRSEAKVESSALAQLKNLASLSLDGVTLDEHFFSAIAELPDLTQLKLLYCEGIDDNCLSGVNNLTNLQTLCLNQSEPSDPCGFIHDGTLLRLRELWITDTVYSQSVEKELFARLPSLRLLETYRTCCCPFC